MGDGTVDLEENKLHDIEGNGRQWSFEQREICCERWPTTCPSGAN